MTRDEIAGIADGVAERLETSDAFADRIGARVTTKLMNGPLRTMIREEVDDAVGEALGDMPRKVDDIHEWFQDLNRRVSELEIAND